MTVIYRVDFWLVFAALLVQIFANLRMRALLRDVERKLERVRDMTQRALEEMAQHG